MVHIHFESSGCVYFLKINFPRGFHSYCSMPYPHGRNLKGDEIGVTMHIAYYAVHPYYILTVMDPTQMAGNLKGMRLGDGV